MWCGPPSGSSHLAFGSQTDEPGSVLGDLEGLADTGLVAVTAQGRIDLSAVASVLGEVSIPERARRGGLVLEGAIRAALLVENLGAFCDLPALDGWLIVHVPGWDTATVALLLERLAAVPVIQFGDLDPNGVRIVRHLRALRPDMHWFVPDFWWDLIDKHGQTRAWPDDLDVSDCPVLVKVLAERGLWLEQEPLVVDPRLADALWAAIT